MVSFTLKNIPEELHQKLKEEAKMNHRSINSEILVRLEMATPRRRTSKEVKAMIKQAEEARGLCKGKVTLKELNAAKNWGRK